MKLNLGVFGSGRGSNFKAVLDKIIEGYLTSSIKVVISNNSTAGILEIAKQYNIPAYHISQKQYSSEEEFNQKIIKVLEDHSVNFILLAGYMKKIDSSIVNKYYNRILNIHPALIPSFCGKGMYGLNVHKAVIEYGCKITGVTVHLVNEEYDNGPIVLQKAVDVRDSDSPEELAERVLKEEHKAIVEAISLFENDLITVQGRKVIRRNQC